MITLCKIDGKSFDVLVTAIGETTTIKEGKNAGTALYRQREIRDIVGVKIGHAVTFAPDNDPEAFDELYEYLFGSIRPSVNVEIVHGNRTIIYEAAYNTANRSVAHIDDENDLVYYGEMTVEFRPMENQIDAG